MDYRISDILTSYMVQFFKTGNPNGEELPGWPESGREFGYIEWCEGFPSYCWEPDGLDALLLAYAKTQYRFIGEMDFELDRNDRE